MPYFCKVGARTSSLPAIYATHPRRNADGSRFRSNNADTAYKTEPNARLVSEGAHDCQCNRRPEIHRMLSRHWGTIFKIS